MLAQLDQLIAATRADRKHWHDRFAKNGNHGHSIEACAAAVREKALLDAREAIVGSVEPGFEFRPVVR